jgi:hypothetical protein
VLLPDLVEKLLPEKLLSPLPLADRVMDNVALPLLLPLGVAEELTEELLLREAVLDTVEQREPELLTDLL